MTKVTVATAADNSWWRQSLDIAFVINTEAVFFPQFESSMNNIYAVC